VLSVIAYDPLVRIHIGPLSISPHGIGIAVGFLVGAWFMMPTSRAKGIPDDEVYPLFTLAAIGAIIGSRVAYVVNHLGDYKNVVDVFAVWKGGISLMGGIIGAILLAITRMRRRHLPFWELMDAAMPGLALGIFVGRTGDLIIADHLGKTTTFFLGYRCPIGVQTGSPCVPGTVVHQTALYDQFFALLILLALLWLRRRPRYDGFVTMMFGALYACARVFEDFLREDLRRFGLTGSQMTAIVVLSACLYGLVVLRRTPRWGRWDLKGPPPTPDDSVPDDSAPEDPGPEDPGPEDPGPEDPGPDKSEPGESSPPPSPSLAADVGGEERPEEGDHSGDPDRGDPVPEGDRDRHG
jgi:phosphatidylglycerol:prolipoprotein diacylglycerol transferase